MSAFTYTSRPAENWQQRAEQSSGNYIGIFKDSVQQIKLKAKNNWLRIIPPTWENPKHYGFDIWWHYGVGPQGATVLCNLKMRGERCSVCEEYIKRDALGDEKAYELKPTRRVVVYVVDRAEEKEGVTYIWAMPWTGDRDISALCRDRQTGELYQIDHPEVGYDINFDREGDPAKIVGLQLARRPSAIDTKFIDFAVANPIPTLLIYRTYEEVRKLFEGDAPQAQTDSAPIQTAPVATAQFEPRNSITETAQPVAVTPQPVATTPAPTPAPAPIPVTPFPVAALPPVAAPVPAPTPAPVPVQTEPMGPWVPAGFCEGAVASNGRYVGCTYGPHDPSVPHLFERDAGPVPPPVAATAPTPRAALPATPAPVADAPRTASDLRSRFATK